MSTLLRHLALRLLQYGLVVWAALTLNFALPRLAPGNPLSYLFGEEAHTLTAEQRRAVLAEYGLDRPILQQYGVYLAGIARGDLGVSIQTGRPALRVVVERVPWTLLLVLPALLLSTTLGTLLGAAAAQARGQRRDTALLVSMLALDSMPGFWLGMLLIVAFAVQLPWFPAFGAIPLVAGESGLAYAGEVLRRAVLPIATITLATMGSAFLLARGAMLATLGEDYLLMARAKGLSRRAVVFRHALRNALLPVYTRFTLSLGALVSGAVVVETVFSYPGLGRLIYESVLVRDYPLLQAAFLLVTLGVIGANLLADLTYPLLDPRVRDAPLPV